MRIQISLVIEMTDEEVERYANEYGLERAESGRVMAKTIVEDVRGNVLSGVQGLFDGLADVSIKR